MGKSKAEYKRLFEDLMEYTDFKSSDDIRTNADLYEFFGQVKKDANKKGRKFPISKKLFSHTKEIIQDRREMITRKIEKLKNSRKIYHNFKMAKNQGYVAIDPDDHKEKYQSYTITTNKKRVIRWRDSKGRFVKTPK